MKIMKTITIAKQEPTNHSRPTHPSAIQPSKALTPIWTKKPVYLEETHGAVFGNVLCTGHKALKKTHSLQSVFMQQQDGMAMQKLGQLTFRAAWIQT